jgi:ArsR family transcriptional regulator
MEHSIRMNGSLATDGGAPDIVAWMSALADSTRARILLLTERHELTVADICKVLQSPQSTVSRHLKVLADDGWVSARPDGTSRLYRMARADLDPAARRLWSLVREQAVATSAARRDERRLAGVIAERRSRSQQFFSSSADQWDHVRRELFGQRFDLLAMAALLDRGWIVGDLGCGTGQMAAAIAPFVRRVLAIESSREMLRAARTRLGTHPNVELRSGDLEALPIDDATLDAATVCLVLHHVASPIHVLFEAARVMCAGGRIMLVDMQQHDRVEYREQMGHVWLGFEPDQIAAWLAEAGFEDVHVQSLPPDVSAKGPPLFVAAGRRAERTDDRIAGPPARGAVGAHPSSSIDQRTARRARTREGGSA